MSSFECSICAQPNPTGARFCNACGAPLTLVPCEECGAINRRDATHCYKCDAALAPLPEAPEAARIAVPEPDGAAGPRRREPAAGVGATDPGDEPRARARPARVAGAPDRLAKTLAQEEAVLREILQLVETPEAVRGEPPARVQPADAVDEIDSGFPDTRPAGDSTAASPAYARAPATSITRPQPAAAPGRAATGPRRRAATAAAAAIGIGAACVVGYFAWRDGGVERVASVMRGTVGPTTRGVVVYPGTGAASKGPPGPAAPAPATAGAIDPATGSPAGRSASAATNAAPGAAPSPSDPGAGTGPREASGASSSAPDAGPGARPNPGREDATSSAGSGGPPDVSPPATPPAPASASLSASPAAPPAAVARHLSGQIPATVPPRTPAPVARAQPAPADVAIVPPPPRLGPCTAALEALGLCGRDAADRRP